VAIGNETLRNGRRCSTPTRGARPAGAGARKPRTRCLDDGHWRAQERTSANTPTVTYTRGRDLSRSLAGAGGIGGLLARSHGYSGGNWSSHNFYHADGNGNVTALANSAGALQASYRYDPYGRHLAGGGTLASANVLRFSSKPWVGLSGSATSGLYYYGYRFYDPYLQRWINRDPIGERGGRTLYSFIRNSPCRLVDPFGLRDWRHDGVPNESRGGTTKPPSPRKPAGEQKKGCCENNPHKDLLTEAADMLIDLTAGEEGSGRIQAAARMAQLLRLAGSAKSACTGASKAVEDCQSFSRSLEVDDCLQCCKGLIESFPGVGNLWNWKFPSICKEFF
jgi:RHS repeat-associated protein